MNDFLQSVSWLCRFINDFVYSSDSLKLVPLSNVSDHHHFGLLQCSIQLHENFAVGCPRGLYFILFFDESCFPGNFCVPFCLHWCRRLSPSAACLVSVQQFVFYGSQTSLLLLVCLCCFCGAEGDKPWWCYSQSRLPLTVGMLPLVAQQTRYIHCAANCGQVSRPVRTSEWWLPAWTPKVLFGAPLWLHRSSLCIAPGLTLCFPGTRSYCLSLHSPWPPGQGWISAAAWQR